MNIEELKARYKAELLPVISEKAEEVLEIMNQQIDAGNNVDEIGYILWTLSDARNKIALL